MKTKYNRWGRLLLSAGLLLILIAIPCGITYCNVRQDRLNHALIIAVMRNDTVAVRTLLHQGADPNAPIFLKDSRSFWQRFWDLLRHKPSPHPLSHDSALIEAVNCIPRPFSDNPSAIPDVPFQIIDNVDTVKALLEAGANVNVRGEGGITTGLIQAADLGKFETMKILLAHNADVNAVDIDGDTALIGTASRGNAEMVEMLLNRGANVNAKDKSGMTALLAVLMSSPANGDAELVHAKHATVACLLRHGASVQGKDEDGDTVMSLARKCHDNLLIQMLKQAGAKQR